MKATVLELSKEELNSLLDVCERALRCVLRPMNAAEAASYAIQPASLVDLHNYHEFVVRRVIRSLKHLPDFSELPLHDQIEFLRVCFFVAILSTINLLVDFLSPC